MKRIVLDASALMIFFENRPGVEKVTAPAWKRSRS